MSRMIICKKVVLDDNIQNSVQDRQFAIFCKITQKSTHICASNTCIIWIFCITCITCITCISCITCITSINRIIGTELKKDRNTEKKDWKTEKLKDWQTERLKQRDSRFWRIFFLPYFHFSFLVPSQAISVSHRY